jgi:hypothetical protein
MRTRINQCRRALAAAIPLDPMLMDEAIISVLVHRNEKFRNLVQSFRLRRLRSLHISNNQFNLNAWDQQSSLRAVFVESFSIFAGKDWQQDRSVH